MNLIYLGKVVNTHGLKGEIRIISDFQYKNDVFKIGNKLYIDNTEYIIESYRYHKIYDMVKLNKINDIDKALKLKNSVVYFNRDDFDFKVIDNDLIGLSVYDNDICKGKVIDIVKNAKYSILVIKNKKKYMVPYIDEFIKSVDLDNKKIFIKYIKGLDDEN